MLALHLCFISDQLIEQLHQPIEQKEIHDAQQLHERAPRITLGGGEHIGFEPTAGVVLCELAVQTQLEIARSAGAEIVVNTVVTGIDVDGDRAGRVHAGDTQYWADKVLLATGAWFSELAPTADAQAVTVTRQTVYWFDVDDPADFAAERFPFVIWPGETIADYSAVFPIIHGGRPGLKLLGEQFERTTTAGSVDRHVSAAEASEFYERLVAPRVSGVKSELIDAAVCLYTNTQDDHFLVDYHPESTRMMVASPCSGHGFKHSTALGEAIVGQLCGLSGALDLAAFVRQ